MIFQLDELRQNKPSYSKDCYVDCKRLDLMELTRLKLCLFEPDQGSFKLKS